MENWMKSGQKIQQKKKSLKYSDEQTKWWTWTKFNYRVNAYAYYAYVYVYGIKMDTSPIVIVIKIDYLSKTLHKTTHKLINIAFYRIDL